MGPTFGGVGAIVLDGRRNGHAIHVNAIAQSALVYVANVGIRECVGGSLIARITSSQGIAASNQDDASLGRFPASRFGGQRINLRCHPTLGAVLRQESLGKNRSFSHEGKQGKEDEKKDIFHSSLI